MTINNPVFEGVKIKKGVVDTVKNCMVKGYYEMTVEEKSTILKGLCIELCNIYGVENIPRIGYGVHDCYIPSLNVIYVEKFSLVSFLHEFRHMLQHQKKFKFKGMTIEQDARAWSIGVYSKAYPNRFIRMVKANRILHIKWDNQLNKVVDNATYI